ncbi:MAG TPA: chorismate mutase [Allosphingosinicella sp.]|jgi:isochorismate pyruvate lyase|nr:chorismate mutase [Allosphingosinicella sp.]
MTMDRPAPEACATMAEVRRGVDALDREIVRRLAERFRYMDAAARIKPERGAVRDEARKAEVLRNVAAHARAENAPEAAIVALYDRLIEASIAYEFDRFDALRTAG